MSENDGGPVPDLFNCSMCGGSGRIVRGNDGTNIRCPECQGAGQTHNRQNRPANTPNRTSSSPVTLAGLSRIHPPSCDCASCTLLLTIENLEEEASPIRRLLRRIFGR